MKKVVRVLLLFISLCVGFSIWYFIISDEPLSFGAQEMPQQQGWGVILFGYVMTLLGVLLGAAYRELQKLKETGRTTIDRTFFKNFIYSIDLWLSLIASPLVYALLWKSMEGGSIASLTIIALENGFCCNVIISGIIKKNSTTTETSQAPGQQ